MNNINKTFNQKKKKKNINKTWAADVTSEKLTPPLLRDHLANK